MTHQPRSSAPQWWPIGVGFLLAVMFASLAGLRLQVLNIVAAAVVAIAVGVGVELLGFAGRAVVPSDGHPARDTTIRRAPLAPPSGPRGHPAPEMDPTDWQSDATDDDLFDRASPTPPSTREAEHAFSWHHLVDRAWKPGTQCETCAEPIARPTDRCPHCGERSTSRSGAIRISTSGPFLDAIRHLPSSGGSDV